MFWNLGRLALDLVYGAQCVGCGRPRGHRDDDLCESCLAMLRAAPARRCLRCGCRLGPHEASDGDCARCRATSGFAFRSVCAAYSYETTVQWMILSAKRKGHLFVAERLASCFAERFREDETLSTVEMIVPVPMHWLSARLRGTNLAELLGRRLARSLHLPFRPETLVQTRPATPQRTLTRTERLRNVLGLYSPRRGANLDGKRVLLVDDVLTTGATATECTRQLKGIGAREVRVAVLARTEPDRSPLTVPESQT